MSDLLLDTLGDVIPLAVGMALSPLPLIAVVLVAMSPRARASAPAFVVGRMLGVAALLALIIAAADLLYSLASAVALPSIVKLLAGAALIVLGLTKWRPKSGEPALPSWMSAFSTATPAQALRLGVVVSVANPKEIALLLAVGLTVGGAPLAVSQEALLGLVFVVLASIPVIVPTVAVLVAPGRVTPVLERLRVWLTANNAIVMGALLVLIGAMVVGGAIADL